MAAYAVMRQRDVAVDDLAWAEHDESVPCPVAHRTREGAERAMRGLVPAGADPSVYAGLFVRVVEHEGGLLVLDD